MATPDEIGFCFSNIICCVIIIYTLFDSSIKRTKNVDEKKNALTSISRRLVLTFANSVSIQTKHQQQ